MTVSRYKPQQNNVTTKCRPCHNQEFGKFCFVFVQAQSENWDAPSWLVVHKVQLIITLYTIPKHKDPTCKAEQFILHV